MNQGFGQIPVKERHADDSKISKAEMSKRIGKSEKTIQRIIASLIEKNAVIRIGSNKTGHWEIAPFNVCEQEYKYGNKTENH